ncbi:MAG: serine hydrolase [Streptosporangiales bacterium]|nr:serine hydrolase [Streptosporangiales bacterium]
MTRYYRSLGDRAGHLDRWEIEASIWHPGEKRDTITPATMANDLRAITLGPALVPQDRKRMIGWLKAATTGSDRIRAGLPEGWTIGDKTGTGGYYGAASDIAIAWPPSGGAPLIIAIYINGRTEDAPTDETVIAKTATVLARALGKLGPAGEDPPANRTPGEPAGDRARRLAGAGEEGAGPVGHGVVHERAVGEPDGGHPAPFGLGERLVDRTGPGQLARAHREDLVHGRDLLGVDDLLAGEAEPPRLLGGAAQPVQVVEVQPRTVDRCGSPGGRGGEDQP